MSHITDFLPLPEVFYSAKGRSYWRSDDKGKWISINEDMAKKYLVQQGYSQKMSDAEVLSPADECLIDIQSKQNVGFTGGLAGYIAGHYTINEASVLVTESPRLITEREGDWHLINGILKGMLNDPAHDQRPYFYSWLKRAMNGFNTHTWTQSQVLAFAGPVGCGKSLLQGLITKMFGGREARAHNYMAGRTDFNSDLFRAEHLIVEDDQESSDYSTRKAFGSNIKQIAVNEKQYCHGKHAEALILTPIWKMTISLNDEPGRLQVLPPIEEDIADKIMLFKIQRQDMPMPTETPEERRRFQEALHAEIPAFLYYLNHQWQIPEALRSRRYGVIHYHHPEILMSLEAFAPEKRLLEMIDQEIFEFRTEPLDDCASGIQAKLTHNDSRLRRQAESLLKHSSMCGSLLSTLCTKTSGRISKRMLHGQTRYTIAPPQRDQQPLFHIQGVRGSQGFLSFQGQNGDNGVGSSNSLATSMQYPSPPPHPLTPAELRIPSIPSMDSEPPPYKGDIRTEEPAPCPSGPELN